MYAHPLAGRRVKRCGAFRGFKNPEREDFMLNRGGIPHPGGLLEVRVGVIGSGASFSVLVGGGKSCVDSGLIRVLVDFSFRRALILSWEAAWLRSWG